MRVMLIIKARNTVDVRTEIEKRFVHRHFEADHRLRLNAYRVDIELDRPDVIKVYEWFNEAPRTAPFPVGTLLFFTVSP